jgi:hypothetical protein
MRGASTIEYGMITALVALLMLGGVAATGDGLSNQFILVRWGLFPHLPTHAIAAFYDDYRMNHLVGIGSGGLEMGWKDILDYSEDHHPVSGPSEASQILGTWDCDSSGSLDQTEWQSLAEHMSDPASTGPLAWRQGLDMCP